MLMLSSLSSSLSVKKMMMTKSTTRLGFSRGGFCGSVACSSSSSTTSSSSLTSTMIWHSLRHENQNMNNNSTTNNSNNNNSNNNNSNNNNSNNNNNNGGIYPTTTTTSKTTKTSGGVVRMYSSLSSLSSLPLTDSRNAFFSTSFNNNNNNDYISAINGYHTPITTRRFSFLAHDHDHGYRNGNINNKNKHDNRNGDSADHDDDAVGDDALLPAIVHDLIHQRVRARYDRDYRTADQIQQQLYQQYHIQLNDREKLYFHNPPSHHHHHHYNNNHNNHNWKRPNQGGAAAPSRRVWNEHGHDYTKSADCHTNNNNNSNNNNNDDDDDGTNMMISEDEIHTLIAKRLQCKLHREFHQADMIFNELKQRGVSIHDDRREWRNDGIFFATEPRRNNNNKQIQSQQQYNNSISRRWNEYGHDYTHIGDTTINVASSVLSFQDIHAKLAQRLQCKLIRNFQEADDIEYELYTHNIMIHDKTKTWRSDGIMVPITTTSTSTSTNKMTTTSNTTTTMLDNNAATTTNNNSTTTTTTMSHDYTLAMDAGPSISMLSDDEIHALMTRRLYCKRNRDYTTADEIEQVLHQNHVFVHDTARLYRTDGNREFHQVLYHNENKNNNNDDDDENHTHKRNHRVTMTQSLLSEPLSSIIMMKQDDDDENNENDKEEEKISATSTCQQDIQTLIHQRWEAKHVTHDYKTADTIQSKLIQQYNVYIHDDLNEWSIGGHFDYHLLKKDHQRRIHPYRQDDHDENDPLQVLFQTLSKENNNNNNNDDNTNDQEPFDSVEALKASISNLVQARAHAKYIRHFQRADDIEHELSTKYNVVVDDTNKEWSIRRLPNTTKLNHDNHNDNYGDNKKNMREKNGHKDKSNTDGKNTLTATQRMQIEALFEAWEDAKMGKNEAEANEIQSILQTDFRVCIHENDNDDNDPFTWTVMTEEEEEKVEKY